jgi:type IX secretion system PorP/SprF family membrane protein
MKNTALISSFAMILLLQFSNVKAQDTRFSQPFNNVLSLNPALMGLQNDCRISLNYRNQWATINNGYTSYAGSFFYPLFFTGKSDSMNKQGGKSRLDFGLNVIDDKSGGFNRVNATFNLSYGLKLNAENSITAGLNLGYIQYSFALNDQTFDEQYQFGAFNSAAANGENMKTSKGNVDVGAGFMWHFTALNEKYQLFASLGGQHLNQPNLSINYGNGKLPARFNFEAGAKIYSPKVDFIPIAMYQAQGPFKQFSGGLITNYKFAEKGKLITGVWYKQSEAVVVQLGYEYKIALLEYSYDFGISQLARTTSGLMTHEITLAFRIIDVAGKKGIAAKSFF